MRLLKKQKELFHLSDNMPVPDFQYIMLPLLKYYAEVNQEVTVTDATEYLSNFFNLTEEEIDELLPSGIQTRFFNRVGWACTHLKKAELVKSTRRGYSKITETGQQLLKNNPVKIDLKLLEQYPSYREFQKLKGTRKKKDNSEVENLDHNHDNLITPAESLEEAYQNLRDELASEILDKLKSISPFFFEKLVVELLVKMGYGGSRSDAGKAIGRSGDGGIDGIIKEDKLGLDVIYIQAKRWAENAVSRPQVQQFAGALAGQKANKGIFITTSRFTEEARGYVNQIGSKIVLIDGEQLAQLMIDFDVGVSTASIYCVKKIDSDYFDQGI
jgi:restriction system protein